MVDSFPVYRATTPWLIAFFAALVVPGVVAPANAQETNREALAFFENDIRPLLVKHCIKCHGPKKAESGLRLSTRETALQGGDSGPAIIPGQPGESLIIQAVRHEDGLEMPPDETLEDREIASLVRWIQAGAAWPEGVALGGVGLKIRGGKITDHERAFWSFQPIQDPQPPQIQGERIQAAQIKNDIDRFVLEKLRAAKLQPMQPADNRVLLRRATFDLTGLPPTPEAMQAFLEDASPQAFSHVVDRLLASQAYGERWGRHWLDVVRYADTAGETADYPTPLSYKYRNWVIRAFNADKPYDQFVREQIAGDILARQIPNVSGEQYKEMLTATGFIAISRRFGFDVENYHNLTIQDTIDTVGQTFLGLTLGCARCHDHKFDPVNASDYYGWYGIFESTRYSFPGSEEKKRPYDLFPALPPARAKQVKAEYDATLAKLQANIKEREDARKALASQLAADADLTGFAGFETQPLGKSPVAPWHILGPVTVAASAQSPFDNVYLGGVQGLALPSTSNNDAFDIAISPGHTAALTPRLHYNIDFRNVSEPKNSNAAYRFYLGHGPGNSAAVEMGAGAKTFYLKNGAAYEAIRELEIGRWYNLQVTLDLRTKTYSGVIGSPGDVVTFQGKSFTTGWDGAIDRTFVDKFGPVGGVLPSRECDNLAVSTTPFLPVGASLRDHHDARTVNRWKSYVERRRLNLSAANQDGHQGYHIWHGGPLPLVGVNASDETRNVPGVVPAGKLVVHPAEKDGVGIAWRSPFSGKVRVTGRAQDAHHDCGDSIAWFVDRLGADGWTAIANGALQQKGSQSIATTEISVQAGEFIQLAIMPQANNACDLTQVDLTISEVGGKRRWSLLEDVVSDFLTGNPQDDRYDHPETWYFYQVAQDRGESFGRLLSAAAPRLDLAALQKKSGALNEQLASLAARRDALQKAGPYELLYAATEKASPRNVRIQIRGDKLKLGDEAPRKNLEIFGNDPLPDDAGSGRLQLADWLTRDSNALMPRVMINRIWQNHFGRGLVNTANDFGARGERPTHPELLDWLASRFQESGYSVKAMHRLIMASAAYQRSSDYHAASAEIDPDSKLLWRFNRRRLSAEEIRDAMLFVSGNLDPTMGGEHPFPAVETWGFTQHSPYYGVYPTNRRSVYLMQQRLKRHPFISLFDGADTNASTARRELTTVPTQALYLMNNAFVHTQAEGLAQRVLPGERGESERIERLFQIALGRSPSRVELADTSQFLKKYAEAISKDEMSAPDRRSAAWNGLARTLLMRNGFLFVD